MQHGAALTRESGDAAPAEAVASGDWHDLESRLVALLSYAVKLTRWPAASTEADVESLRRAGLDDRAIVDANQVVSYFNYVNRVADGLGVELEPEWPAEARARHAYAGSVPADSVPWLSVEQMREVDRMMVEDLTISLERMMENAGARLAELARRLLGGGAMGRRIAVLAGPGGNGGGGLVAARHLANAGADVVVFLAAPRGRLGPVTLAQHDILDRMGIPIRGAEEPLGASDLVVDALLGYSQEGPPRARMAELIRLTAGHRVLALDVPSGLELATGVAHDPHVAAEATLTLAAPKSGLRAGRDAVGTLFLADISVPSRGLRATRRRLSHPVRLRLDRASRRLVSWTADLGRLGRASPRGRQADQNVMTS